MMHIKITRERALFLVTILIIFSLFMIPASASTIADLELISTKHSFGPGIGGIESKEQTILLPNTGWLTITYQTEPYLGNMKGGPDFFPKDLGSYYLGQPGEKIDTPPEWVKGQPGKYVIKSYINTPQGDRPYIVKLVAPWECQTFQICNAGTVYAAKQRLTYEYTPDSESASSVSQGYPDGTLLKGSGVNVYIIENGMRRLIPDEKTFNSMGYNWNAVKVISDNDLSSIPQGTDLKTLSQDYPDGTLLKGSGVNVYIIENGMRRWIPDEKTFNSMGYNWNAIKVISDNDLFSIPQGVDIT